RMKKGASIYGRLTYGQGDPVGSCVIKACDDTGAFIKKVNARPDGSYLLNDLPSGRVTLSAINNADFILHCQSAYFKKAVDLRPGESIGVDWNFEGNSFIRGICTINGKEADGIEISLIGSDTKSVIATAYTYDNGYYEIRPIPEGKYIVEAHSGVDGVGGTIRKEIAIKADDGISMDFDFGKVSFKGEIKGSDGKPVYGCWLTLNGLDNQGSFRGFTDYFGKYQFYHLPAGPYRVEVRGPGYGETVCEVNIPEDAAATKDFTLEAEGILKLQVLDAKGEGFGQTQTLVTYPQVYSGYTVSNDRGLVIFKNLPEGKVAVLAGGGSYAPCLLSTGVVKGETVEKKLQLTEGGTLIIKVRNLEGAHLSNAVVSFPWSGLFDISWSMLKKTGFLQINPSNFSTDSKGTFTVSPLPAGTYPITVTAEGASWSGEVQIQPGKSVEVKAVL
ncbi:MAG: carboxypeptidase regulatory-like domain-containing protein, partial [Planctomycetes bacterium]|nr:carboxypeptidase regulatory-like domain-containing protein [Planctomycetota bacterium]